MEYQVRTTRVAAGRMDEFVEEWTAHVARLRRRRGFTIVGAWIMEDTNEFLWILGYDGEDGFAAADAEYRSSVERRAIEPDPARLIEESNGRPARRIV